MSIADHAIAAPITPHVSRKSNKGRFAHPLPARPNKESIENLPTILPRI